jgi:hypothetical protein
MPPLQITRNDNATAFGSESLVYLAECKVTSEELAAQEKTIASTEWVQFPCVIEEVLSMEPKSGELLDDSGRVVHSFKKPSKAKYAGSIFQRDKKTFEFLRTHANTPFAMWVVVGQIGDMKQEILMYGKLGGNYSENMNAEPKIPIEFNCEVNPVTITFQY